MIEQINIALEQKGSEISQPGSLKPQEKASETNVRKESIYIQLKVMKNEHPAFFPPGTGRYCKFT